MKILREHATFLFSTINRNSSYSVYDFGYVRETTNDDYRGKYRRLYEKESVHELVIRDKGYIETDPHITAMISLKGSDGEVKGILCVQRQMDALVKARHSYLFKLLLALAIFLPLVIIIQSVFLQRELLRPLKIISGEATRFSLENVTSGVKLRSVVRSRDEIGQLAGCIDDMEDQIQSYVENLTMLCIEYKGQKE